MMPALVTAMMTALLAWLAPAAAPDHYGRGFVAAGSGEAFTTVLAGCRDRGGDTRRACPGCDFVGAPGWVGVVRGLYLAFRVMTGLRTTQLPLYTEALHNAGFRCIDDRSSLAGLLTSQLWQYLPADTATESSSRPKA